jgi:YebC/PmpR family DNA-binding regulatory protein
MPKDKIDSAIKRAVGRDATDYEEIRYEGYGPHGIALVIETATDNPVRTVANLRTHFNRGGGALGTDGSVTYLFRHMGVFTLRAETVSGDPEELELDLIDSGLDEMGESETEAGEPTLVLRCAFTEFGNLQRALEERGIEPLSAEAEWVPLAETELDEEATADVLKLIERLEGDDDVQTVFHTLA